MDKRIFGMSSETTYSIDHTGEASAMRGSSACRPSRTTLVRIFVCTLMTVAMLVAFPAFARAAETNDDASANVAISTAIEDDSGKEAIVKQESSEIAINENVSDDINSNEIAESQEVVDSNHLLEGTVTTTQPPTEGAEIENAAGDSVEDSTIIETPSESENQDPEVSAVDSKPQDENVSATEEASIEVSFDESTENVNATEATTYESKPGDSAITTIDNNGHDQTNTNVNIAANENENSNDIQNADITEDVEDRNCKSAINVITRGIRRVAMSSNAITAAANGNIIIDYHTYSGKASNTAMDGYGVYRSDGALIPSSDGGKVSYSSASELATALGIGVNDSLPTLFANGFVFNQWGQTVKAKLNAAYATPTDIFKFTMMGDYTIYASWANTQQAWTINFMDPATGNPVSGGGPLIVSPTAAASVPSLPSGYDGGWAFAYGKAPTTLAAAKASILNSDGTIASGAYSAASGGATWGDVLLLKEAARSGYTGVLDNTTINLWPYKLTASSPVITFDKNDNNATGTMSNQTFTTPNGSLSKNNFKLSGYSFNGWNTSANGSGNSYSDQQYLTGITADMTLYAQWTARHDYKVIYHADKPSGTNLPSGSFSNGNTTYTKQGLSYNAATATSSNPAAVPANAPSNEGGLSLNPPTDYTSMGFYLYISGGSPTWYKINGTDTYEILATKLGLTDPDSIDVYIQWNKVAKYTVTYDANNGTGSMTGNPFSVSDGGNHTVQANPFSRTGYTFSGWNTAADGNGTRYSAGDTLTVSGANVTLYAQWTGNQRTIKFDGNGATSGSVADVSVNKTGGTLRTGDKAVLPANGFTLDGYQFDGWVENKSDTTYLAPGNDYTVPAVADANSGTTYITLHAHWSKVTNYEVYFDASNGGTITGVSGSTLDATGLSWPSTGFVPGKYTYSAGGTSSKPTRTNYTLSGWYVKDHESVTLGADDTATAYSALDTYKGNGSHAGVTMYAKWTENTVTITYTIASPSPVPSGITLTAGSQTGTTITLTVGKVTGSGLVGVKPTGVTAAGYKLHHENSGTLACWTTTAANPANAGSSVVPRTQSGTAVIATDGTLTAPKNASTGLYDTATYYLWLDTDQQTYTVEYWLEQLNGTYTHANASNDYTGQTAQTGDVITPSATATGTSDQYWSKSITGYEYDATKTNGAYANNTPSITIGTAATIDGSSVTNVLRIYYKLSTLNIYYNAPNPTPTGWNDTPAAGTSKMGKAETSAAVPASKGGYDFSGWTAKDGNGNDVSAAIGLTSNTTARTCSFTMPGYDIWLTPSYTAHPWKVNYKIDTADAAKGHLVAGGSNLGQSASEPTVNNGAKPTKGVTVAEDDSANWNFVSWSYTDENGANQTTSDPTQVSIYADTTFTAVFEAAMAISYDPGTQGAWTTVSKGSLSPSNNDTIPTFQSLASAYASSANTPNDPDGYTFSHWQWTDSVNVVHYWYPGRADGDTVDSHINEAMSGKVIAQSITFIAQWTEKDRVIEFNDNGADSGSVASINTKTNASETLPANGFTRAGYAFKGWSRNSNATAGGSDVKQAGAPYTVEAVADTDNPIIFYAIWDYEDVTIKYIAGNGGSVGAGTTAGGSPQVSETLKSNGTATGATAAADSTHQFKGWYVADNTGAATSIAASTVTGNMLVPDKVGGFLASATYIAVFESKPVTVTFTSDTHGHIENPAGTTVASATESVSAGSHATMTNGTGLIKAQPDANYQLAGWEYSYYATPTATQPTTGTSPVTTFPTDIATKLYGSTATFKAIYTGVTGYYVAYVEDGNGGRTTVASTAGPIAYDAGITLPTVSKAGYNPTNWHRTAAGAAAGSTTDVVAAGDLYNALFEKSDAVTQNGNTLVLFIEWTPKSGFEVHYDLASGAGNATIPGTTDTSFATKSVKWDETALLPGVEPQWAGHTFLGWFDYNEGQGTDPTLGKTGTSTKAYNVLANNSETPNYVTLYAHWEETKYLLHYVDELDSSNNTDKNDITWEKSGLDSLYSLASKNGDATHANKTFVGWEYKTSSGARVAIASATQYKTIALLNETAAKANGATLYAKWSTDGSYTVEYWLEGATSAKDSTTKTGVAADTKVYADNNPQNPENRDYTARTIPGYTFDKVTDATGSNNVAYVTVLSNGTVVMRIYYKENDNYRVKYDLGGAPTTGQPSVYDTPNNPVANVKWTQTGLLPASIPVWAGHTFGGWKYTPQGGTETKIAYANGAFASDPAYSVLAGGEVSLVTLTADWSEDTITIAYQTDGTNGVSVSVGSENGKATTDFANGSKPNYDSTQYQFVNWTYDDGNGNPVNVATAYPGWVATDGTLNPDLENGVMVARTYTANFRKLGQAYFTIERYFENLDSTWGDGNGGSTPTSTQVSSYAGSVSVQKDDYVEVDATGLSAVQRKFSVASGTYTGFTYNPNQAGHVSNGTVTVDGNGAYNLVLKLYFTRNAHKVTYQYSGTVPAGSVPAPPAVANDVKYGSTYTVEPTPTFANYTFTGWTYAPSGVVTSLTMPDSDVVLTGTWTAVKYDVEFRTGDSTKGSVSGTDTTQRVSYGGNATYPGNITCNPIQSKYYHAGWYYTMDEDGDGAIDLNVDSDGDGTNDMTGFVAVSAPGNVTIKGATTFYAYWLESFGVTYAHDAAGIATFATSANDQQTQWQGIQNGATWVYTYAGETENNGTAPKHQAGYTFLGWQWTDGNGTYTHYVGAVPSGKTDTPFPTTVTQSYTFYPVFEADPVTLVYMHTDLGGNVGTWSSTLSPETSGTYQGEYLDKTHKTGETAQMLGKGAISRTGWELSGWTTDGNDFYAESTGTYSPLPAGVVRLYPVWGFKNVTITYVADPTTMGGVTNSSDSLTNSSATPQGSTPQASTGYEFDKWVYVDNGVETDVNSAWVDANNKLTPQTESGVYVARTYKAKFKASASNHYVVEWWFQDLGASTFSHNTSVKADETVTATTGAVVTVTPQTFQGFTYDTRHVCAAANTKGVNDDDELLTTGAAGVKADGSTVLRIFYTRDQVKLAWAVAGDVPQGVSAPAAETHQTGDSITVPPAGFTTDYPGYTFSGWTADSSDVTIANGGFTMPGHNVTVTATWTMNKNYQVLYDEKGGTTVADLNPVSWTQANIATPTTPATMQTGMQLVGWYTVDGGTSTADADWGHKVVGTDTYETLVRYIKTGSATGTVAANDVPASITLFARWEVAGDYNIYYRDDHATKATTYTSTGMDRSNVSYHSTNLAPATSLSSTKQHYQLGGWAYWDGNAYVQVVDASGNTTGDYSAAFTAAADSDATNKVLYLYPVWEGASYTIHFDKNDTNATGTMADLTFKYGAGTKLTPNAFSLEGYDFAAWNSTATGTAGTAFADNGPADSVVDRCTPAPDGKLWIYARWTPKHTDKNKNPYTVTYVENGGIDVVDRPADASYYGVLADPTPTDPVYWNTASLDTVYWKADGSPVDNFATRSASAKKGYNFMGWWTVDGGTSTTDADWGHKVVSADTYGQLVKLLGGTDQTTNLTLYARWDAIKYTLRYMHNDGTAGEDDVQVSWDGKNLVTNAPAVTRAGYTLKANAWNTKVDGTGTNLTDLMEFGADLAGGSLTTAATGVQVFAQWEPRLYTIHYVHNDGTGNEDTQGSLKWGDDGLLAYAPTALTLTGYTLDALNVRWNTKADGTGSDLTDAMEYGRDLAGDNDQTRDVYVYAQWTPITYVVRFDGNGAAAVAMADEAMTYDVAKALDANTFARKGYTFAGWSDKADGTGASYSDGQSVTNLSSVQDDVVTLYAQWDAIKYTLHYVHNDGTAAETAKGNVKWDDSGFLTDPAAPAALTRTGYTLDALATRWNTKADGTGADLADAMEYGRDLAGDNDQTRDVYVYAQWTPVTYVVRFDGNGAAAVAMADQTLTYDQAANLTANTFARKGYTFTGWNTKADGTGTAYADQASVTNLSSAQDDVVTLYAQWDAIKYTLHYVHNDGTAAEDAKTVKFDDSGFLTAAPQLSRAGYTLVAAPHTWNLKADGTGADLADAMEYGRDLAGDNDQTRDVYVYAQWTPIKYLIRFKPNAGDATGTMADMNMVYGQSADLTANAFYRKGYSFVGWNRKADGTGTAYADQQNVSNLSTVAGAIVSLYAQWDEVKTYIVHYVDSLDGVTIVAPDKTDATWTTTALYPNDPTKSGYKFDGWEYADASGAMHDVVEGTTAYSTLSDAIDPAVAQDAVTLLAKWVKLIDYTVTYWTTDDGGATLASAHFTGYGNGTEGTVVTSSSKADATHDWTNLHHVAGYTYSASLTHTAGIDSITLTDGADNELRLVFERRSDYVLKYDHNYKKSDGTAAPVDTEGAYWAETGLDGHAATRQGYKLTGWNTKADGSGRTVASADQYGTLVQLVNPSVTDEDAAELTLYAQWRMRSDYTVRYDPNYDQVGKALDGTAHDADKHVPTGDNTPDPRLKSVSWNSTTLDPVSAAKMSAPKGYHFVAWTYLGTDGQYHKADGMSYAALIAAAQDDDTMGDEEILLHATWAEDQIKLHYTVGELKSDGTVVASTAAGTVNPTDETLDAVTGVASGSVAAANPGWHFVRWERVAKVTASGLTTASVTGYNVLPSDMNTAQMVPGQNTTDDLWYEETYRAVFEENDPATLHYDKNAEDATGTIADVTKPYGSLVKLDSGSEDATADTTDGFHRDHWKLIGWNTEADGSGTTYALSHEGWVMPKEGDTLYAMWEKVMGRLIYDKNAEDATGTIADVVKQGGTVITLDSGTEDTTADTTDGFHREHYILVGWNTKADFTGTHYDLSEYGWVMPDGTTVLYAEWQKMKYEVSGPEGTKTTLPDGGEGIKTDGGYITGGDVTEIEYGDPVPEGWIDAIPEAGKHVDYWTYTWTDEDGTVHTETADDPTKFTVKGNGTITAVFADDPVEEPETPAAEPASTTPAAAHAAAGETIPQTSDTFDAVLPLTVAGLGLFLILLAFVARRRDDEDDADAKGTQA